MMQFTFTTDDPGEAARIMGFLNGSLSVDSTTPAASQTTAASDDFWADDPADAGESDPWGSPAATSSASAQTSTATPSGIPKAGVEIVDTPNGKRKWTFGLDRAPQCGCGLAGALVEGKSANGKLWAKWQCPKGFSRELYKQKCDLNEFTKAK